MPVTDTSGGMESEVDNLPLKASETDSTKGRVGVRTEDACITSDSADLLTEGVVGGKCASHTVAPKDESEPATREAPGGAVSAPTTSQETSAAPDDGGFPPFTPSAGNPGATPPPRGAEEGGTFNGGRSCTQCGEPGHRKDRCPKRRRVAAPPVRQPSLLERARAATARRRHVKVDREKLELALAWLRGDVTGDQVASVLPCTRQAVAPRMGVIIARAVSAGLVRVEVVK